MALSYKPLSIPGAFIVEPRVFPDNRGQFFETWRLNEYEKAGLEGPFLQDNLSYSHKNVVRGLHYEVGEPQGQMVTVVLGRVFDVIVDLRGDSPTFGRHEAVMLDDSRPQQVYMPPGIAHGFCVLSERAILHYKSTRYYRPESQRGIRWNDPDLAIDWPCDAPVMSERDRAYRFLKDLRESDYPTLVGSNQKL